MSAEQEFQTVSQIDWENWTPVDVATLLFVFQQDKMLLIQKKRGLGAGKINAPGGKLEEGESPLDAALREIKEEVGIRVEEATYAGEHRFQFTDGYAMHVYVYRSDSYDGEPVETEEAIPFWCDIHEVPYEKMWEDDRHWIPLLLRGERFVGQYVFHGDSLLSHRIQRVLQT